jgi:hypothetical protein
MRTPLLAVLALALAITPATVHAQRAGTTARQTGRGIRDGARTTGRGVRDGARQTGRAVRDGARETGRAIRDVFRR